MNMFDYKEFKKEMAFDSVRHNLWTIPESTLRKDGEPATPQNGGANKLRLMRIDIGDQKGIDAMQAESRWGSKFFKNLSRDLKEANPKATCFSPTNLLYMKNFYCMYKLYFDIGQQVADQYQNGKNTQQLVEQNKEKEFTQQVAEQIWKDIISIPWGHHMLLIDKYLDNPEKALFYVRQTVQKAHRR